VGGWCCCCNLGFKWVFFLFGCCGVVKVGRVFGIIWFRQVPGRWRGNGSSSSWRGREGLKRKNIERGTDRRQGKKKKGKGGGSVQNLKKGRS